MSKSTVKLIQLEEEIEGDQIETTDFFFDKIGDSVPLTSDSYKFDLEHPPSRPLAVSERFRLIFVAHSSGFWVARTKDVMESAKELKATGCASSIQDLSLVYVPIGKVHILALSADSSTLATSVGGDIHFFSVESLLRKEQKPSYSCSLNESNHIKDMQWTSKLENLYVVLSSHGRLYHGTLEGPLKVVMDDVDAVEWNVEGNLVAVARKNVLSIMSSKFKERLSMLLSFRSWVGSSDVNCVVKVDSIRWVRPDCIILGCLQVNAEGMEENYLVQVITTEGGKLTDGSSVPVVLSFSDLFPGLIDDIIPCGSGPHLLLSYLEQCELAIGINRKNTDQHIVLIGWSKRDETKRAAVIDINRDTWLPRIELQDSGDDNLVLGLCIDKVSLYEKVKVQLGVQEPRELSPYCVLFCLTLEGRLSMFHVVSVTEAEIQLRVDSCGYDDEEEGDIGCSVASLEHDLSKVHSGMGEVRSEQVVTGFQLHEKNKKELHMKESSEISAKNDLTPFELNISSTSNATNGDQEVVTFSNSHKLEAHGKHLGISRYQSKELEQSSSETSHLEGAKHLVRKFNEAETKGFVEVGYSADSLVGKSLSNTTSQLNKDSRKAFEVGKELPGNIVSTGFQSASTLTWSTGNSESSKGSHRRDSHSPSSSINGHNIKEDGPGGIADASGGSVGSPLFPKDTGTQSASLYASNETTQTGDLRILSAVGNIDPLPSIRNSQLKSQDEKLPNYKLQLSLEKHRSASLTGQLNSEPKLSKQFGNIKDMTKELDALLECVVETGGFRDACTVFQRNSVVALEQGLETLSEKCRMCKSLMDGQLEEIQHLFDNTIEVLARKTYIEGIVKQATDSRYWDLWNRQKLSSELELKRQHMLRLNQTLTTQLIEMERHFNSIELNKFGDDYESRVGRRASESRFGPPRHIQSLHSLHKTMSAQLAAAEQLSKSLSKQMAALSIELPGKENNIKRELFETIGIPYDGASFSSLDASNATNSSSFRKFSVPSSSATDRDQWRKRSSMLKNYELETARRRRDSLDTSWARFEPPKTTVKRMVLQESQKVKASKTFSSLDKQKISSLMLDGSVVPHPKNRTTSNFMYPYTSKGMEDVATPLASDSSATSLFKWAHEIPTPSQTVGSKSQLQGNNLSVFSLLSATQSLPVLHQSKVRQASDVVAERPRSDVSSIEKSDSVPINEPKFNLQFETRLQQAPSMTTRLPSQSNLAQSKSSEMPSSSSTGTLFTKSTGGNVKPVPISTERLSLESGKVHESPAPLMSTTSQPPKLPGRVFNFGTATSKSQSVEKVISSPTSSVSIPTTSSPLIISSSVPFSSLPDLSAEMSLNRSFTISKTTLDTDQKVASVSSSSSSPIPFSGSSFRGSDFLPPSPPLTLELESPGIETQPSVGKFSLKTDTIFTTQAPSLLAQPSVGDDLPLKLESAVSPAPAIEASTGFASGYEPSSSSITSPTSSLVLNPQPEQPSSAPVLFPALFSTSASGTGGKIDNSINAVTQEDDMEEEAPETGHTADLNLGSLGGFGLGSTPNSAAPRTNPFDGPFGNPAVNPASPPFGMANPNGELFRPASFSFQSPQPSQSSQAPNLGAFSGGFAVGTTALAPNGSSFGQPSQIKPGQQALGSVLGAFGQSRQLGAGLPGAGGASASAFGSGFSGTHSAGGFANAAPGGGFSGVTPGGGFAGVASAGGGFAGVASAGGGFTGASGGGFGGAASGGGFGGATSGGGFPASGGGFGGFSNQLGSGGFSAFGSNGNVKPQSDLFTQMRK